MNSSKLKLVAILLAGILTAVALGQEPEPSAAMTARIDQLLDERLLEIGWSAAAACDDAGFVRRVCLDLTGVPPTGSEVLHFVDDANPSKRLQLVERLLVTSACADHLAETWAGWMLPEQSGPQFGEGQNGLRSWLRNRFAENLRYDRLVSDLLVASGPAQSGPTVFFTALEGKPEKIAAKTARVFMGVQLDCAECHNHPFDNWTQRDFWGFAAYFAQLSTTPEQSMMGVGEVTDTNQGEVTLPGTEEIIAPKPLVDSGISDVAFGTRRQQLTLWLTTPENPFLAQATVNRVWSLLMGRGLIEPIDDMRNLESASHPQLLQELSDFFASSEYDLRELIRVITATAAYSRASLHASGSVPEASYAVMANKPLTARQLSNSVLQVARQIDMADAASQAVLVAQLGQLRGDASQAKLGIVSALVTLHGEVFDRVSREDSSRLLKALEAPHLDEGQRLRWMFLCVLNRLPTQQETAACSKMMGSQPMAVASASAELAAAENTVTAANWHSDLLWALMNSTEFAMTP